MIPDFSHREFLKTVYVEAPPLLRVVQSSSAETVVPSVHRGYWDLENKNE